MSKDKIINPLPKPEFCDNCASVNVSLETNDKLYGRKYGDWPFIWFCGDCRSAVGCHEGTDIPLGRMSDNETRLLRSKCHHAFDPIWKSGIMTRSQAYHWLASWLEIPAENCHISWLSKDQLQQAIKVSKDYYERNQRIAERRINRRIKRESKRIDRDRKARRTHSY